MNKTTIRISKIDASRRQLDSAIRLWFADGDPVTIHSLAWAAYQIVQDINEKRGDTSVHLLEMTRKVIKPEHIEEVMRHLKKPMTFFKHADRDPHEVLEFNPAFSETIFLFAIKGLELLGEQPSDVQRAFYFWTNVHSPHYFVQQENRQPVTPEQLSAMRHTPKLKFLEESLLGLARARSK